MLARGLATAVVVAILDQLSKAAVLAFFAAVGREIKKSPVDAQNAPICSCNRSIPSIWPDSLLISLSPSV